MLSEICLVALQKNIMAFILFAWNMQKSCYKKSATSISSKSQLGNVQRSLIVISVISLIMHSDQLSVKIQKKSMVLLFNVVFAQVIMEECINLIDILTVVKRLQA